MLSLLVCPTCSLVVTSLRTDVNVAQHEQKSYFKHHKTSEGRLEHFCIMTALSGKTGFCVLSFWSKTVETFLGQEKSSN